MPKVAINEQGDSETVVHEVRPTRKFRSLLPEPDLELRQKQTQLRLGAGPAALDRPHDSRANLPREHIHGLPPVTA
jgi:hypothetical protein